MSNNSSNNERIAKNSIFLSIRMVIVLGISLYTTRVLLQILGVEDYGVYNVVCGFVSMFGFLNGAMSNGIQRFYNFEYGKNGEDGANKVYCTAVLIQIILAIIIIILTESIGLWYLHRKMVIPADRMVAAQWIFQLAIVGFLFTIMQAPFTAAVIAHERMGFYAYISILDAILKLVIVFVLPRLNADQLVMYGLLMNLIIVINFMIFYIYCKKKFKEIKLHRYFNKQQFRSMLSFSGWNVFGTLSGVAQEQGVNLVINFFFGPIVNAARSVAAQVNSGMQSFVHNITQPVRPQVIQSYAKGEIDRTMHLTFSISKLSCCFLAIMAVPICVEIGYVMNIWLKGEVPEHAANFAIIVLITSLNSNLNSAVSTVVHATGNMKKYQLWGSLVKICCVPASFLVLLKYKEPELALLCVWFFNTIGHIVCLFILRTLVRFSIKEYLKEVVVPIFVVIVIGVLSTLPLHLLLSYGFMRFFSVVFVGVLSVVLSTYYIALNRSERIILKDLTCALLSKIKIKK